VGHYEPARAAGRDGLDEVRFGSLRPRGHRWPRWLLIVIAAAASIAVVVVMVLGHQKKPHRAGPLVAVSDVGHRLLGVTAGWQLLAYGPGGMIRIQFAGGRITRTAVPPLQSTGSFSFVVGPSQAIIRPLDFVPGYLVPDGHPARRLRGALGLGGPAVVPGPQPGLVWVQAGYAATSMSLAWLDGRMTGVSMRLPPGSGPWLAAADGQGYALVFYLGAGANAGAVYDVRPSGFRRIAGSVSAAGPTRWLTVDCNHHRCSNVVVDPASGERRRLPGQPARSAGAPGVIAPDGSAAAVIGISGRQVTLHLIDLASGTSVRIPVTLDQGSIDGQTLAWSPDSRWLFVVTARGRLAAVGARTHRVEGLGVALPPVSQIAIRSPRTQSQRHLRGGRR
jgi:hypothetical protein